MNVKTIEYNISMIKQDKKEIEKMYENEQKYFN